MKISRNIIKDKLCNNVILKVASIIFAVAMWLLVINIDDPQVTTTIKNIPVHILNESAITGNDEAYDILSGDTVDIKVTGPRTIVDSLTKDDFTATADFKDLSKTSAVPINVSINNTRYESKVTISEKSQNAMRLSVMALVEREYELGVEVNGTVQQEYVLYETVPRENTVVIKAPESVHKRIGKVALRLNLLGSETESFSYLCGAVAYDYGNTMLDTKANHMTISNANIAVDGVVYYRKSVEINYDIVNNMGTEIIMTEYEVSADRVDIVGAKELLDGIHSIDIPKELTVLTNAHREIRIDLNNYLPEGVVVYNENSMFTVTTKTEDRATKAITVRTGDIGIRNIPDGYEASISSTGNISVVLSGRQADINAIDAEKLAPYVDLSTSVLGENSMRVNVILPEGIEQNGNINVTVVVTEKSSSEPESSTENPDTTPQQPTTDTTQETTTEETKEPPQDETTTPEGEPVNGENEENAMPL